ncbi:MAG TPA: hypothetical protein PKA64_26050 [Myxococcota bacterium]|nr:hypothetical protein [Myxococcota bacterium]
MTLARAVGALVLLGTVDRVEGRWLVVEWRVPGVGIVWSDLRRARVGGPVVEGDPVCLVVAGDGSRVEAWLRDGVGRGGRVRGPAAARGGCGSQVEE